VIYPTGATSVSVEAQVVDDTGLPVTGLVAATFPSPSYALAGAHASVAFPSLSDLALITSAYVAGGVKERAGGYYRLDVPNGAFATAGQVVIFAEASGKHVIIPRLEVGTTVGLVANAISESTIATPAEAAGRPAGLLGMLRRLFEKRANRRTRDRSSGAVVLYGADNATVLETETQSTTTVGGDIVDQFTQGA